MTDRVTFYMPDIDYSNKYAVPKKLWHSWGLDARAVFNRMFEMVTSYPSTLPRTSDAETHRVIAWNSACLAAESVEHLTGY